MWADRGQVFRLEHFGSYRRGDATQLGQRGLCGQLQRRQQPSRTAGHKAQLTPCDGVRVGIEAAVRQGWEGYISDADAFVGMGGFGASAPADELYEYFGITAEAVVAKVRERIK